MAQMTQMNTMAMHPEVMTVPGPDPFQWDRKAEGQLLFRWRNICGHLRHLWMVSYGICSG
jgi:hypothetical protein